MRQLTTGFNSVYDLVRELDSVFDRPERTLSSIAFRPTADVHETEKSFLIDFDLPGTKLEDINLEIKDKTLTVRGERKLERTDVDSKNYKRVERSYGKFERAFTFPENVDVHAAEANFENGVLQVSIPKKEITLPKTIPIQIGKATKSGNEKH